MINQRVRRSFEENIEKYRKEGSFTTAELIQNTQALTGIYPINMVMNARSLKIIDNYKVPPLSEYDPALGAAWCIPIKIVTKKTKAGKWFHTIDVIDSNSEVARLRCWGVNPDVDIIYLNKPYVLKYPKFNETWGFSTYGSVDKKWMMIG